MTSTETGARGPERFASTERGPERFSRPQAPEPASAGKSLGAGLVLLALLSLLAL